MTKSITAHKVTKGIPYHLWQNAMRMSITQYKTNVKKVNSPDMSKRNWLIFKLRKEGKTLKEIGEIVGLSKERVRVLEILCCRSLLKNIKKLQQREPKNGRIRQQK